MSVYAVSSDSVVLCVGSALANGLSIAQGVVLTVHGIEPNNNNIFKCSA
jgi:hypothetical protein